MTDLTGQCVLVTGAARGIGLAVARRAARDGARVLMCDLLAEPLDAAARTVGAESVCADVRDTDRIAAWLDSLGSWPDTLVNNAAIAPRRPLAELDEELLSTTLAVNVVAAVRLAQRVAGRLVADRRAGGIINVSSVNAYRGHPDLLHYNASKAALLSATRTMAAAWARHGIRVNAVCPGSTRTDIWADGGFSPGDRDGAAAANPMGRLADPDEIAEVVAFLASPSSSFVTGAEFVADGGLMVAV